MTKNSSKNAFTLVELLCAIAIIFIVGGIGFGLIGGIFMGNQWYSDEGVLKAARLKDLSVTEIVTIERNIWRKSILHVKFESGKTREFTLDSDCLLNYKFEVN